MWWFLETRCVVVWRDSVLGEIAWCKLLIVVGDFFYRLSYIIDVLFWTVLDINLRQVQPASCFACQVKDSEHNGEVVIFDIKVMMKSISFPKEL